MTNQTAQVTTNAGGQTSISSLGGQAQNNKKEIFKDIVPFYGETLYYDKKRGIYPKFSWKLLDQNYSVDFFFGAKRDLLKKVNPKELKVSSYGTFYWQIKGVQKETTIESPIFKVHLKPIYAPVISFPRNEQMRYQAPSQYT